jgi:hypothetical protein
MHAPIIIDLTYSNNEVECEMDLPKGRGEMRWKKGLAKNNLEKIWSYNLNPLKLEEYENESTIHYPIDLTPSLEFLQKCIDEDKLLMNL